MSLQNGASSTSLGESFRLKQLNSQMINKSDSPYKKQTQLTLQYGSQQNLSEVKIKYLIEQIKEKTSIALYHINKQQVDTALTFLLQAEKKLQKVSQFQNANKKLIVCVLHNLACCYQKNWELQICSNYLQALIYNINCYVNEKSTSFSQQIFSQIRIKNKQLTKKNIKTLIEIQNMERLGYYYLQYCAVNSQIKNHSGALIAARKSIQTLKKMFKLISSFLKDLNKTNCDWIKEDYQAKYRLVHQISKINDNISINQYQMILETTKYYLRRWSSRKTEESHFNSKWFELQQRYKNFSIGTIAQINVLVFENIYNTNQKKCQQLFSYQSLLQKILTFIVGYFTISTQLRLMSNVKENLNQNIISTQTSQFKQSEIFHLFSIMLTSIFVPFQILYMKHILMSYKNHFHFDLNQYCEYSDNKVYQDFLFTISEIKKPSLLALSFEDSLRISEIGNQVMFQEGTTGTQIKFTKSLEQDFKDKLSKKNEKTTKSKNKIKSKSKSKTKSKSQNKKSTLKTISALSAQSKPKNKKSEIKKTTSKQKSKSQGKSSLQKQASKKLSYLQTIHSQKNCLGSLLQIKSKKRKKSSKKVKIDPYYNLIKNDSKNKNHAKIITQTNEYFLNKKSSKRKDSKSKNKSKNKQLSPINIYYHKFEKQRKKNKSKQKGGNSKSK